ncbi:unnamed protein product [Diatraea saccharalis]|uniref:Uncharacterized protein n=1 Tax=Diatraea saccharalis TaxID=40085 RepID=A0A9N9QU02_9NEOP|nr:unnamed protein product [Diatraea saccharalis]
MYDYVSMFALESGLCSSLLCGRTKELELGTNGGVGSALALAMLRPPFVTTNAPCQLKLTAPDGAAFTVRLIDVKKSQLIHFFSKNNVLKLSKKKKKMKLKKNKMIINK